MAFPTINSSRTGRTFRSSSHAAVDFWPLLPSQILGDSIPFVLTSSLNAGKSPNSWVNSSMASPAKPTPAEKAIKRGAGKRIVEGASFRLADEVRYIQRRAADHDGRVVTVGQLVLFSTGTGDAWLLDRSDRLAARLARDGETEPVHIEETDTAFTISWKGHYRLDGPAFVYSDRETGRVVTILGYPTDKIADTA